MPKRPNVLFLLSDEHSFRFQGRLQGRAAAEPVRTPHFDALAARATTFEHTYCQYPLCTPSRLCMLTGVDPRRSGGWNNNSVIADGRPTIASTFSDAGYATCLMGKMHLGGRRQFAGFQHRPYGDLTGRTGHQFDPISIPGAGMDMRSRTAHAGLTTIPESMLQERVTITESIAWLREHAVSRADQPWLLCASFSRPHFPLTAPARWFNHYHPDRTTPPKVGRSGDTADHPMTLGAIKGFQTDEISHDEAMRARAAYFACVSFLDEMVGDLLHTLERDGLLENTIIVYTSDHGELAGEHGLWWKNTWHEAAARVPWYVQLPEQRAGSQPSLQVDTPVTLADLFPTLAGLCDVKAPDDLEGKDLSATVRGEANVPRRVVRYVNPLPRWGENTEHVVLVDGRLKYVAFREARWDLLFDLDADPLEQHNLIALRPDEALGLRAMVEADWDFTAAEAAQTREMAVDAAAKIPVKGTSLNQYHLPDGRVIEADAILFHPMVVADRIDAIIDDAPGSHPATPAESCA